MKHWLVVLSILFIGVAVPWLSAGKGDAVAGKAVYTKKCGTCHGPAGEAKEPIAKMLKVEMRHLGSKDVQAKSDTELGKAITQGTGKMKPVTGLSDVDVANLIVYVRSLSKK